MHSGRKIIDILNRNPSKDPEKYEEDDLAHMRKVVSYCKVGNFSMFFSKLQLSTTPSDSARAALQLLNVRWDVALRHDKITSCLDSSLPDPMSMP